jgi:hypothetical protein
MLVEGHAVHFRDGDRDGDHEGAYCAGFRCEAVGSMTGSDSVAEVCSAAGAFGELDDA